MKESTNFAYHGHSGPVDIIRRRNAQVKTLQLKGLNMARKIGTQARDLDDHTRLMAAIASGDVRRVDRLMKVALNAKCGVRAILDRCGKAAAGVYSVKSFDERDYQRSLLNLRLGGARLAGISHKADGTPSLTTLRAHSTTPRIPQVIPSVPKWRQT